MLAVKVIQNPIKSGSDTQVPIVIKDKIRQAIEIIVSNGIITIKGFSFFIIYIY